MKLTHSLVAMATLTTLSFAGGDINPVTVFEQEPVMVPVEAPAPVVETPVYEAPAPVVETPVYEAPAPVVQAPVVQAPVVQAPVKVEPKVVAPVAAAVAAAKPLGLYLGLGLTDIAIRQNHRANLFKEKSDQDRQVGVTARLGYDFMDYLGAELRGTYGVAKDDANDKFKQLGAYLKPNYDLPFLSGLNAYGLLGVSKTSPGVDSETGFSYGLGLDYGINDKVSVFTDVLNYMKKSETSSQWGLTAGAAYNF